jgi:hypothetical protein
MTSDRTEPLTIRLEMFMRDGPNFLPDLFGTDEVRAGSQVTLDDGSTITFEGADELRSASISDVIMLLLAIPPSVLSAMEIASRLKGRGPKRDAIETLTIDRQIVEFDEGEIRRVIDEKIEHRAARHRTG